MKFNLSTIVLAVGLCLVIVAYANNVGETGVDLDRFDSSGRISSSTSHNRPQAKIK